MAMIEKYIMMLAVAVGMGVGVNAETVLAPGQIWKEGAKWTEVLIQQQHQNTVKSICEFELKGESDVRGEKFMNVYVNGNLSNYKIKLSGSKLMLAMHFTEGELALKDSTYVVECYDYADWVIGSRIKGEILCLQTPFTGLFEAQPYNSEKLMSRRWIRCPDYEDVGLYMYSCLPDGKYDYINSPVAIQNIGFVTRDNYGLISNLSFSTPCYPPKNYVMEFSDSNGKVIFRHPDYEKIMAIYRGDYNGMVNIGADEADACVVYSLEGRIIYQDPAEGWSRTVSPGIYLLRQGNKTGKVLVK